MKALFLDFDGVLHHRYAAPEDSAFESVLADPDCLAYANGLAEILEGHEIQMVVHSNWRLNNEYTDDQMRQLLRSLGTPFVGTTPVDADPDRLADWRYDSIRRYVAMYHITDYRILDDAHFLFPARLPELIACHSATGVSDLAVQAQIKEWLAS